MLSILSCIFLFLLTQAHSSFVVIPLPPNVTGPESLAFDLTGVLYTGVTDGRIFKFQGLLQPGLYFAATSASRTTINCDGISTPQPICGRPLGLEFYTPTQTLYIADAFAGLLSVGRDGGLAKTISTSADTGPFVFLDGLDVDQPNNLVYFTDASAVYDIRNVVGAVLANDSTGRLLKYNPGTNMVTTLMRNLSGAGGVAVSRDSSFLLVTEYIANRIQRFWLTGPKANTSEIFLNNITRPDNIKTTLIGDFWIAAMELKETTQSLVPIRVRVNQLGRVLESVSLEPQYGSTSVSEVQQAGGLLFFGSVSANFIGVYGP